MEQHNTNWERQAAYEQGKQLADFLFDYFGRSTWEPLIVKTGERDKERVIFDDGSDPAVSRVTPTLLRDIKEAVEHPEKLLNSEAIGKKLSIEFDGKEVFVKPAPLEPAKPPSAKPAAAREPAPRLDTHDFTPLVKEPRPDVVTQPWMTDEPRHKISRAMAEKFTVLRQKRVANTALALLQKYGETQGNQTCFEAEGYHLSSEGALIRIADRHNKELALIHKPSLGRLRLVKYDLTATQEGDFLSANTVIRQRGLRAIAEDSFTRRRQLGALAPAGDHGVMQDLQALVQ